MKKLQYLLPFIFFVGLIILFKYGLMQDPNYLPSVMIGKPVPAFSAETLDQKKTQITENIFKGDITLLNVWASWCQNCQMEHPLLIDLAKSGRLKLYSLNYKDKRIAATSFLLEMGNPYQATIFDPEAKVSMQLGVYGTPETFLIDKQGMIRYRYVGPLTLAKIENDLLPRIKQLEEEGRKK